MEGTVDKLNIAVTENGITSTQKSLDKLYSTLQKYRQIASKARGSASKATDTKGTKDATDATEEATIKTSRLANLLGTLRHMFSRSAQGAKEMSSATGQTSSLLDRLKTSFQKTDSPLKNFISSLKRIAFYRMIRAIIKAITQAISEGVKNIYNYSKAVGTSLAPALDSASSATLTFKNSIGAALAPVLESLIPILVNVCNWLTTFMNTLAGVFAALGGKSSYTAAVAATAQFGDDLSSAAGSAKELKRQLMGFDELNVLDNPNTGGGGGGASTPDYSSMFEEREVGGSLKSIVDKIKSGNFGDLGKALTDWMTKGINKATTWLESKDFSGMGSTISTGISSLFEKSDSGSLFKSIGHFLSTALNSVTAFINGFDFTRTASAITQWLVNGIAGVKWGELLTALFNLAVGIFDALVDIILGVFAGGSYGLADILGELGWEGGEAFFNNLGDFFTSVGALNLADILDGISQAISDTWENIKRGATDAWTTVKTTVVTKFDEIRSNVSQKTSGIRTTLGIAWLSIKTVASTTFSNMKTDISDRFSSLKTNLSLTSGLIKLSVSTAFNSMKDNVVNAFNGIKEKIKTPINSIIGFINKMISGIVGGINSVIGVLNNFKVTLPSWLPGIGGKSIGFSIRTLTAPQIPYLSEGGLLNEGQLFIANENEPELVANFGNKTGVMNNEQIIDAVSRGVYEAVRNAMGENTSDNEITVNVDGKKLFEIIRDRNNSLVRRTGRSPLLT